MSVNPRSDVERWLNDIKVPLVNVRLYIRGDWIDENHVEDAGTIAETVAMSLQRLGGRYAVWRVGDGWMLFDRMFVEKSRTYPTKEAAEMVAMHHG